METKNNEEIATENAGSTKITCNSATKNSLEVESTDIKTGTQDDNNHLNSKTSDETCSFDSADSTNDADFLKVQEGVQSALVLMEESENKTESCTFHDSVGSPSEPVLSLENKDQIQIELKSDENGYQGVLSVECSKVIEGNDIDTKEEHDDEYKNKNDTEIVIVENNKANTITCTNVSNESDKIKDEQSSSHALDENKSEKSNFSIAVNKECTSCEDMDISESNPANFNPEHESNLTQETDSSKVINVDEKCDYSTLEIDSSSNKGHVPSSKESVRDLKKCDESNDIKETQLSEDISQNVKMEVDDNENCSVKPTEIEKLSFSSTNERNKNLANNRKETFTIGLDSELVENILDPECKSDLSVVSNDAVEDPKTNDNMETQESPDKYMVHDLISKPDKNETSGDKPTNLLQMIHSTLKNNEEFRRNLKLQEDGKDNIAVDQNLPPVEEAEVILLDDDDESIKRKKKPPNAKKCVNPNCESGEDLDRPPMFVLTYFGLKRSKDQKVCAECFNIVAEHQEKLAKMLNDGANLFTAQFPNNRDVILLDSDEEDYSDEEENLSDDTMSVIQENIDEVIAESLIRCELDHQIRESCHYLDDTIDRLEEGAKELTERLNEVQSTIDDFRNCVYKEFNQPFEEKSELMISDCEIPPMPVVKSKLQNMLYNQELTNRLRERKLEQQRQQQLEQQRQQKQYEQQQKQQQQREEQSRQLSTAPIRTIAIKKISQSSQSQQNMSQDVIALHSQTRCDPPPDLPPPGPLFRPKLKVGELAYTMKVSYFSIWVLCRVLEVIPRNITEADSSTETYRIRLENMKKNSVRTVTGKYLAYPEPASVQLNVGTRVIAIFKEDEEALNKENYYVGVIAEPPKSTNKYRYLVFFDDGYTQYCPHSNILVVCHTSKNVWEDIHPEPRDFIKNYLLQYPERPMVKMSQGQVVKVEWNGRWWIVRVLEVDASLVKVHFDADRRTEWIYRGSTRLGPMYQELAAAKERQSGNLLRTRGFGAATSNKSDMPYVEYTRGDADEKKDEEKDEKESEQRPVPVRSVAKKSTAKKPVEPVNAQFSKPIVPYVPQGKVTQRELKPKCQPLMFRTHLCNQSCVAWTDYKPAAAKKYDPLIKPLIYGFERLTMSFKGKTVIMYRGPCGRMLRNAGEMHRYLQSTKSLFTIDLFDFDFWVNPLNEFDEAKTFSRIEDLSYGKENVPISCVNELDHSMPPFVQYMTARQPHKDVRLNLDEEFLICCDCTDDCSDREKCSCWQLTMEGKAYVPDGDLDPLFGYQYRRLPERIATGIYECNSRCKCSMSCQNRVAQQPLSFKLQLFKTLKKGWGIRCLHDIPRGAFICIYAGFLLTEQEANEGGKEYGDEYLAELDYIESVEGLKEGYESEAREMSDQEEEGSSQITDSVDMEYNEEQNSADSDEDAVTTKRNEDIRLRLRRRRKDEGDSDKDSRKDDGDTISISDDEAETGRQPQTFNANIRPASEFDEQDSQYPSVREMYGNDEHVYIMDAKTSGNIGRYLNHSCSPNVFVQNVFVDTHDLRFPWVAFFANQYISAGTELTWDYNYDVGSVPGKVMLCYCNSANCRGRLL